MKKNVSLRTFLILVVVLGAITGLTWEYWLLNPVRVEQVVMGQVTSGEQCSTRPLTVAELEWAVKRQIKTKSSAQPKIQIQDAIIEEVETSADPPANVPLLGYAQLQRTVFKCQVRCKMEGGPSMKRVFFVEKNHYHMLGVKPSSF